MKMGEWKKVVPFYTNFRYLIKKLRDFESKDKQNDKAL